MIADVHSGLSKRNQYVQITKKIILTLKKLNDWRLQVGLSFFYQIYQKNHFKNDEMVFCYFKFSNLTFQTIKSL
jgi:hypothetical protein